MALCDREDRCARGRTGAQRQRGRRLRGRCTVGAAVAPRPEGGSAGAVCRPVISPGPGRLPECRRPRRLRGRRGRADGSCCAGTAGAEATAGAPGSASAGGGVRRDVRATDRQARPQAPAKSTSAFTRAVAETISRTARVRAARPTPITDAASPAARSSPASRFRRTAGTSATERLRWPAHRPVAPIAAVTRGSPAARPPARSPAGSTRPGSPTVERVSVIGSDPKVLHNRRSCGGYCGPAVRFIVTLPWSVSDLRHLHVPDPGCRGAFPTLPRPWQCARTSRRERPPVCRSAIIRVRGQWAPSAGAQAGRVILKWAPPCRDPGTSSMAPPHVAMRSRAM